jgi:hypothetical protein
MGEQQFCEAKLRPARAFLYNRHEITGVLLPDRGFYVVKSSTLKTIWMIL